METMVMQIALAVLTPVIGTLASIAVGYLIKYIRAKTGIEIEKAQEEKIQDAAKTAVKMAEEWAATQLKGKVQVSSNEKFDYAINAFNGFVPDIDLNKVKLYVQGAVSNDPDLGACKLEI